MLHVSKAKDQTLITHMLSNEYGGKVETGMQARKGDHVVKRATSRAYFHAYIRSLRDAIVEEFPPKTAALSHTELEECLAVLKPKKQQF